MSKNINAIITKITNNTNINHGDCSWNPQPTLSPLSLNQAKKDTITINDTITPPKNSQASRLASLTSCTCLISARALSDKIGNTHGIKLRIKPPTKAISITNHNGVLSSALSIAVFLELTNVSCASAAIFLHWALGSTLCSTIGSLKLNTASCGTHSSAQACHDTLAVNSALRKTSVDGRMVAK